MHTTFKHTMLTGASIAFLALAGASLTSAPAQAGPLSVTPKAQMALTTFTEKTQLRHRRVGAVRYARRGYYYRGGYGGGWGPGLALGLFAGALGAAAFGGPYYGTPYYCDPAYYTWNYGGCGYSAYPAYYGGYYPAYYGGYYPIYRRPRVIYRSGYYPHRRVIYRTGYRYPRTVAYRAAAPRAHFVGSRTYVRSGTTVRHRR